MYTKDSLFSEVFSDEKLMPFMDFIIENKKRREEIKDRPLSDSRKINGIGWESDKVIDTLNNMDNLSDNGTLEYIQLGDDKNVGVVPFIVGNNAQTVIILPGGGYHDVCGFKEGFMIATVYNRMGFNAIVGWYSVDKTATFPQPMDDLSAMVKFMFDNSEKYNLSTENYSVLGFSAGGHLAASWGAKDYGFEHYKMKKPGCLVLCYPVVTMGEYAHTGSRDYLLGEKRNDEEMRVKLSIEKQVTPNYPRSFIWHCTGDNCVPFKNSEMLAKALEENNVKNLFRVYEGGDHGWGLAGETVCEGWIYEAIEYWQKQA